MIVSNCIKLESCSICGNTSCYESYDHSRITHGQLFYMVQKHTTAQPAIQEIVRQVDTFYTVFEHYFLQCLREDRKRVMQHLKKIEFAFLEKQKASLDLASQISNGDFSALPSRKVIQIVKALEYAAEPEPFETEMPSTLNVLMLYTGLSPISDRMKAIKAMFLWPKVQQEAQKYIHLKRRVSVRKSKQCYETEISYDYSFVLKGVRCKQTASEIQLNQKALVDFDLFEPISNLSHFPKLIKLELRYNKITEISCRLIASNLKNLSKLDIRDNKLKDSAVIVIAKNLKNLTELYVCDNYLSDQCMAEVVSSLQRLTLIWLQNNRVTFKGAYMIIRHDKVKAIGLQGNIISRYEAKHLKTRFTLGYMSI